MKKFKEFVTLDTEQTINEQVGKLGIAAALLRVNFLKNEITRIKYDDRNTDQIEGLFKKIDLIADQNQVMSLLISQIK